MNDKDQKRRERAYKIWEDEGRPEGADLDHWQRAEDQHEATEAEVAAEVTGENPAASAPELGKDKPSPVPPPISKPARKRR
ncbi:MULTISPECIES: DUF2934 domain-containing protein [unclassified Rhizobium]|jgi:hypothetical protein|uniref:DUF2934 domain-containing protein n=1 Tax=Rhizobium sp. BG4 TaxID=2613770 RepID=UPI00193C88F5|nr:DUF2934 domain-containing protein [Rhizobium sp. BG4]QRM47492.1 DUF2934 domain-containing protein [Rhizobium sp. BG4]